MLAWAMRIAAHLLALLLAIASASTASLCQTITLDRLFAQLRDPATGSAALRVEAQIWDEWMHAGDDAENEALAKAARAMNAGDGKAADAMLTALVAKAPDFAEAWNKRATLYFLMGRYDESLADIGRTLDLEPRHFGALSGQGMIYQRLGKKAEAIAAFKEALLINPNLPGAKLALKQLESEAPDL